MKYTYLSYYIDYPIENDNNRDLIGQLLNNEINHLEKEIQFIREPKQEIYDWMI